MNLYTCVSYLAILLTLTMHRPGITLLFVALFVAYYYWQDFREVKPKYTDMNYSNFKGVSGDNLNKSDELYRAEQYDTAINFLKLQYGWKHNEEILWRLSRSYHSLYTERPEMQKEAFEFASYATKLAPNHSHANLWAARLLKANLDLSNYKISEELASKLDRHILKANRTLTFDPTNYHTFGTWYFSLGNMLDCSIFRPKNCLFKPYWLFKKALEFFKEAHKSRKIWGQDGNYFESKNYLMIAKTQIELGEKEEAEHILRDIVNVYPLSLEESDKEVCISG